jgi:hypothetical protein
MLLLRNPSNQQLDSPSWFEREFFGSSGLTWTVPLLSNFSWFEREFFGSAGRTRTYNPWVNRIRALLLKMQDLRLVSGEKTQSPGGQNLVGPRVPASVTHPGAGVQADSVRKSESAKDGYGDRSAPTFPPN